jgi:hypothetical protein
MVWKEGRHSRPTTIKCIQAYTGMRLQKSMRTHMCMWNHTDNVCVCVCVCAYDVVTSVCTLTQERKHSVTEHRTALLDSVSGPRSMTVFQNSVP